MKRFHITGLLLITILALLVVSDFSSAAIISPSSTGFGGLNRTENLKNMTGTWLKNNATFIITFGGQNYLITPWFTTADSTRLISSDLHGFQNGSWNKTNESFAMVTDETSRAFYAIALSQYNDTLADAMINTMIYINDSGRVYTNGHLGGNDFEWTVRVNLSSSGVWGIYMDQVADTAHDASAYLLNTLWAINTTPYYNSTNRQRAGALAAIVCNQIANNSFYDANALSLKNRVNPGQTVRYFPAGGSNVASSLTNGDFDYQAYKGPILEELAACHANMGDNGTFNFTAMAEDTFQVHLIEANFTAGVFTLGQGRAGKFYNASSGQTPAFTCTTSCLNGNGSLGVEDPDSMRVSDICRGAWVWQNLTGRTLENSSAYCQLFGSNACLTSTGYGYKMYFNGTVYGSCPDTGFKAVGLGMSLYYMFNTTNATTMTTQYNSHYACTGNGLCQMDGQNGFGIYDKSFGITDIEYYIGAADYLFNGSFIVSSGSGGSNTSSSNGFQFVLNTPANASTLSTSFGFLNISMSNLNNTDFQTGSVGNGTFLLAMCNMTSGTDSCGMSGGTLNTTDNTTNSFAAGQTWTFGPFNQTNYTWFNWTFAIFLPNASNDKFYPEENLTSTSTDPHVLVDMSGNLLRMRDENGSGGGFSKTATGLNNTWNYWSIIVNRTANKLYFYNGSTNWTVNITVLNNYSAAYFRIALGNEKSMVKITNMTVTVPGAEVNTTTTVTGNASMNLTLYMGNGTVLANLSNAANGTSITYNWTGLVSGTYTWFVGAISKDGKGNSSLYQFTVNAVVPVISSVVAGPFNRTAFMVNWTTSVSTNASINYGTTLSLGTLLTDTMFLSDHSENVTNLVANTTYFFNITVWGVNGNKNTSGPYNTTTLAPTPPVFSLVSITALNTTAFMINWTTDQTTNSSINYGNTTALGTLQSVAASFTLTHSETVSGLSANTTYYANVTAWNVLGDSMVNGTLSVTTMSVNPPAPAGGGACLINVGGPTQIVIEIVAGLLALAPVLFLFEADITLSILAPLIALIVLGLSIAGMIC